MYTVSNILLLLAIACSFKKGLGAASFVSPLSGPFIGNFEGAVNATTIVCNVTEDGSQVETTFSVANFRGVLLPRAIFVIRDQNVFLESGDPFFNELTITNWTSEVDEVILYCGTTRLLFQANVTLRLYRPPSLQDNLEVKILEGDLNVPINLLFDPETFPEPSLFEWLRDGQPLRQNGITTTYFGVTLDSVVRSDAGNYTVSATNFVLDNATQPVGSDSGSFSLNVLYPPSFVMEGPMERYVLLGDSLSLVCGTGLDSNPQATITWTAPNGTTVVDNDRYDLENGAGIVRLNFTNTIVSDNGVWRCEVTVVSERYFVSGGVLVRQDSFLVGSIAREIQLKIIAVPGPPSVPAVDSIGATWALICWEAPLMANSPISRYQIIGREVNGVGVVTVNTTTNATSFNVTGLLPGTAYSLTVVAVSEGGDVIAVGQESPAFQDATGITVPEVECFNPVSANGSITVQWYFVHTGGLNLTGVSAEYSYVDGTSTERRPVTVDSLTTTTITQRGLVAGFVYTFSITAENSNGSSTVSCRPTPHTVGVPREPQFGDVTSGPGAGEVTLEVKTVASGVDNRNQSFRFIITPVLGTDAQDPIPFDSFEYQSGDFKTITVRELEQGRAYSFSATAMNIFGTSSSTTSPSVLAGGRTPPPTSSPGNPSSPVQGDSTAAAIGGAVGGVLFVVIIVAIVIVVVAALLIFRKNDDSGEYRPNKSESVRYAVAPTREQNTTKVEEVAIDLGDDMGSEEKSKLKNDNEVTYADLETIRVPVEKRNNSVKNAKPAEFEEPVEYAVITNFIKKEKEPVVDDSAVPEPVADPTPDTTTTADGEADKTGTSTTLV